MFSNHVSSNIRILQLSILLLFVSVQITSARTLFVSTTGSQKPDGSHENPYTIEEAIEQATNPQISTIVLLSGTYQLERPLTLNLTRSPENPLTIRADQEGEATLSGGIHLNNPSIDDSGRHIFELDSAKKSRDLFIGNQRATRARSIEYYYNGTRFSAIPKLKRTDPQFPGSSIEIEQDFILHDHTRTVLDIRDWKNIENVEFVFRCAWWEKRCGIESIQTDSISPIEPAWTSMNTLWGNEQTSRLNAAMPKRTHIEGAIELLDSPGEWHQNGNRIYMIPISPDNQQATVTLAQLENLITLEDSSHISFVGINFCHTTWDLPLSTLGFNEGQANVVQQGEPVELPSALTIRSSNHVTIESCSFKNLGAWGVDIREKSHSITVKQCELRDIGATAIRVGSTSPQVALDRELQCSNIRIKRNWIHNAGSVYFGSVGIFVGYASKVEIDSNEVCHIPYTGISVGWGWNSLNTKNVDISNNRISNNYVHTYLNEMYDGGAVYTLGTQGKDFHSGLTISGNLLTKQGGLGNVIYSDGGSSWITIEDNTTFNNLSELDLFYEGRSKYVPDWGGCNPLGNLRFINNTLGNAPNKTPNFRCSPSDPPPWQKDTFIPPNTFKANNHFSAAKSLDSGWEHDSKQRHRESTIPKTHITYKFANTKNRSTYTRFSLKEHSSFSFNISESDAKYFSLRSDNTIIEKGSNLLKHPIQLPPGHYTLTVSASELPTNSAISWTNTITPMNEVSVETNNGSVNFEVSGTTKYKFVALSRTKHTSKTVKLKSRSNTIIAQNDRWVGSPYDWRILRAMVDHELTPQFTSSGLNMHLPAGSFRVESNHSDESDLLFIATETLN